MIAGNFIFASLWHVFMKQWNENTVKFLGYERMHMVKRITYYISKGENFSLTGITGKAFHLQGDA